MSEEAVSEVSEAAERAGPAFVIVVEGHEQVGAAATVASGLAPLCEPILGFAPHIEVAALSSDGRPPLMLDSLPEIDRVLERLGGAGHAPIFLLPAVLDLSIAFKQLLGASMREAQRARPDAPVFCDDVDPCHPLLLHAFFDAAASCLHRMEGAMPNHTGLMLVADGEGDAMGRARSYQLMRLLWEQLRTVRGEVAFLRHEKTPLPEQLDAASRTGITWVVVPEFLFTSEHLQYAKIITDDFNKRIEPRAPWPMAPPIGTHPNVAAWLQQRVLALWKSHRDSRSRRAPSVRAAPIRPTRVVGPKGSIVLDELAGPIPSALRYGEGVIVDIADNADLGRVLQETRLRGADLCFVKVTWHGYAPGTFTDAVALDALLGALPCRAVVLEGHTSSRNTGGADFDWETDARRHRAWIKAEEQRYLERTGLGEVMRAHGATYLNVTEAHWDGACAPEGEVRSWLEERGVTLHHDELLGYVPELLLEHAGAPMISFARFKGPTRLSISNLFGLLPDPLRTAWHGPNLTYMARVCCDLARLYGALFDLHGVVEGLSAAVRWDRKGLNRSRWGNYDVIEHPGLLALAPDVATADVLASRLQGQDVRRSAFFDVVRAELGYPDELASAPIEEGLIRRLG